MIEHWLWLKDRKGLGARGIARLMSSFPNAEALYACSEQALSEVLNPGTPTFRSFQDKNLRPYVEQVRRCRSMGIGMLTPDDPAYPGRLRHIPDPPPVLYYKGTLPDFDKAAVLGVVGTRKATRYGLDTAHRLGRELARAGAMVVSGVATGIDGASMQGALEAGGIVVGVLGCGIDRIYPAQNASLYRAIPEQGCLLSEYGPGIAPNARFFPVRNRIISGLSCGVIVVEAPERSGALITANLALEQGRDVFAVPGNVDNPQAAGAINLLSQGAGVAQSGSQIMEHYSGLYEPLPAASSPAPQKMKCFARPQKKVDKPDKKTYSDNHKVLPKLKPDEIQVLQTLSSKPIHVDEIIAAAGLPASRVLSTLTVLEIDGVVKRHNGKYFSISDNR